MRPRQRDIECSISSLTRNQSTGVPRSPSPWFGFESLSAHSLQRGERGLGAGAVQKRRAGGRHRGRGPMGAAGGRWWRGGASTRIQIVCTAPYRHLGDSPGARKLRSVTGNSVRSQSP